MKTALVLFLALLAFGTPSLAIGPQVLGGGGSPIPPLARAAGYTTLTFSNDLNFSTSNVDMGLTNVTGFNWYFCNFFGSSQSASKGSTAINSDGSISAFWSSVQQCSMASAVAKGTPPYFTGTAFGGGAYIEFEASINPKEPGFSSGFWPAVWMMSLEHLDIDHGDQWVGAPAGYVHFLEKDVMEFIHPSVTSPNVFQTTHDWSGIYQVSCPATAFCEVSSNQLYSNVSYLPAGTDFAQYHKYAVSWIPATALVNGSITYLVDDVAYLTTTTYAQYTSQAPPATTSSPWLFGVGDNLHDVLLISPGVYPIRVKSVHVWQASTAGNLYN